MKKSTKIYLGTIAATVLFIAISYGLASGGAFRPHHRMATDPMNIEKITGVDLPDPVYNTLSDNLDRGSSRWDNFYREIGFVAPLTDEQKSKLDRLCAKDTLHWVKEPGRRLCYEYHDDAWGVRGDCYTIYCRIYEESATCEYLVDEGEGLFLGVICFAISLLLVLSLIIWGLILVIVAVVKRIRRSTSEV